MSALPPGAGPVDPSEPSYGYQVPPGFGGASPSGAGGSAYDPLVPPPFGGLRPLWERLGDLVRRSWRPLGVIILLTFAVPQVLQSWVVNVMLEGLVTAGGGLVLPADGAADGAVIPTAGASVWLVVAFVVVTVIGAIGWGAGIWVVTQTAAAQPVSVGTALTVGVRRVVPMFGWYLLYTLMIMVGVILFVLPGLYLLVAGGLFSFAVMYERDRNPMGRSFSLVHRAFGAVVGRFALLGLFMLTVFCVLGLGFSGLGDGAAGQFASDAVLALVMVPVTIVLLVGMLLTYTQVRARQEQLSSAALWAAVNEGAPGPGPVPAG